MSIEELIKEWQERQIKYEGIANENRNNTHNYKKFTYLAKATRDCWKELSKLHQPTVIGRFCKECGNTNMLQGNGIIEPLCTCNTESKTHL